MQCSRSKVPKRTTPLKLGDTSEGETFPSPAGLPRKIGGDGTKERFQAFGVADQIFERRSEGVARIAVGAQEGIRLIAVEREAVGVLRLAEPVAVKEKCGVRLHQVLFLFRGLERLLVRAGSDEKCQ